jgi:hypothetical protein
VLVVSEICAKEHRISATQAAGTRGKAGVVGESSSCAAVGVAEKDPLRQPMGWTGGRGIVSGDPVEVLK